MSTAEIGLSVRTTNCLEERGILTVQDLLNSTSRGPSEHLRISAKRRWKRCTRRWRGSAFIGVAGEGRTTAARSPPRRLAARGDRPWLAASDSTKRNVATAGPALGWSAASGEVALFRRLPAPGLRLAGQGLRLRTSSRSGACPRVRRAQVHRARKTDRRERGSDAATLYRPEVHIAYRVNGVVYHDWAYDFRKEYTSNRQECAAAIERYVDGRQYSCWYDPANPRVVVL